MVTNRPSTKFYLMDFDELGVVGKLALSAFQRHQNYHQPSNINTFRGNIVIFGHFRPIFFDQKISIFDAFWWYLVWKWPKCTKNAKHGHEMHQYCSADDDFSVVGKLGVPAIQRRQARQNPSSRRSIRDHVLIQHPHFLSADAARKDKFEIIL